MIAWTDKEGISEHEAKHQTYAALRGIAERRGYKNGWVAWRFKEIFGRWPNGEAVELADAAGHELLAWDRIERTKYRKSMREREGAIRLADMGDRVPVREPDNVDNSSLMTADDWGVKW